MMKKRKTVSNCIDLNLDIKILQNAILQQKHIKPFNQLHENLVAPCITI